MNKNDNKSFIPQRPFTEEQLMQKPRPSYVTVIRGSKVNHFNLETECAVKENSQRSKP